MTSIDLVKSLTGLSKSQYQKRSLLLAGLMMGVLLVMGFFLKQTLLYGLGFLSGVMVFFTRQLSLDNRLKANQQNLESEFIFLFGFFRIFIDHQYNVYQALKALIPYASFTTKNRLETLILAIDEDKTITPFLQFAQTYQLATIEQLMISVYQLVEQGSHSRSLTQFTSLFQDYVTQHSEIEIDQYRRKLERYQSAPLIASAMVTILIAFGIVSLIGGMLSGF